MSLENKTAEELEEQRVVRAAAILIQNQRILANFNMKVDK